MQITHEVERLLAALTCSFGAGEPASTGEQVSHVVPARLNQPCLDTLATVTRAIHGGHALQPIYHSMKKGAGMRTSVPHSLVDSGLRWNVRAKPPASTASASPAWDARLPPRCLRWRCCIKNMAGGCTKPGSCWPRAGRHLPPVRGL